MIENPTVSGEGGKGTKPCNVSFVPALMSEGLDDLYYYDGEGIYHHDVYSPAKNDAFDLVVSQGFIFGWIGYKGGYMSVLSGDAEVIYTNNTHGYPVSLCTLINVYGDCTIQVG